MTRPRASPWIVAVVVAVVAVVGAWTVRRIRFTTGVQVATAPVTTGAIVRHIVASGTLQAVTTVQIGAQVSGTIQSLDADFNSIVRKGQVLAKLDPALFEAALGEAQAALAGARAAAMQAEADRMGLQTAAADARTKLTRTEELSARQLVPQSDLDAARIAMDEASADLQAGESRVKQAGAAVEEAKAAVDQASVALDHTVIASPIDGIVVARNVDVGQTVASAFQAPVLFSIAADLRRMQVDVHIDEADIGGVQQDEPAAFEVESYSNQKFEGTVSEVRLQPQVVDQTPAATVAAMSTAAPPTAPTGTVITYETIVDVLNPDEKLRPGMTATVTLDGARRGNVLRVPNNALLFRPPQDVLRAAGQPGEVPAMAADTAVDGSMRRVWRFDHGRFTPIDVLVGLADDQWTELVRGSVRSGEALVTAASIGTVSR